MNKEILQMNKELDDKLCAEFPKIFKNRNGNMQETCMCWGFEVGDGWYNIIRNACLLIQHHIKGVRDSRASAIQFNRALKRAIEKNDDKGLIHYFAIRGKVDQWTMDKVHEAKIQLVYRPVPESCPQVVAEQVKEKFGSLRFYVSGGDSFTDGVVQMAELMSEVTCEKCGHPGKVGGKGWMSCRCDICRGETK
jgi:hypothetical protein